MLKAVAKAGAMVLATGLLLGTHAPPTPPRDVILGVGNIQGERTVTWVSSVSHGYVEITGPAGVQRVEATSRGTQRGLYAHTATVDVEPGAQYSYHVGAAREWSGAKNMTVPGRGDSWLFAFFGDPQVGVRGVDEDAAAWREATQAGLAEGSELMVSAGDQVQQPLRAHYAGFLANPDLQAVPWAVALGNHDARDQASFGQHFGHGDENWAFEYKGVRFLMLDGNEPERIAGFLRDQADWSGWTIAVIHQPPYTQGKLNKDAEYIRDQLTNEFAAAGVDLVMSGHNHSYTRSKPIKGVTYLAANSSTGSKFYDVEGPTKETTEVWNQDHTPDFTTVQVSDERLVVSTRNVADGSMVDEFILPAGYGRAR